MNRELAKQYCEYDNTINQYFDSMQLDYLTDAFRFEYYKLRNEILKETIKDNQCTISTGDNSIEYTKHPDYDDTMIRLLDHYYHTKLVCDDSFILYEIELMIIEHYIELNGYHKDDRGYWY